VPTLSPTFAAAQHVSFFPTRPPGAAVRVFAGTIEHFGIGTGRGDLTVATTNRRESFAMSYPYRIDGKEITCHQAPRPDYRPPPSLCVDWPQSIVLGRTKVRVSYWTTVEQGRSVKASDSLTSAAKT